uniref:Mab-21-like HhH/H2TH-like domain-containing protein n=1 Tax=Seriola lalandi dorsalis TaxID=1841481 RepID=A0A3B4YNZ1_SERLL
MHITESYCPYLCTGLLKAERRRVMDGEARELSLREVSPTEATPSPRLNQRQRVQRVQQQQSSKTGDAAENFSPSVPTELLTLTPHSLKSCLCHFAGEGSTVEESVSISPQLTKWIKDNAEDLKIRQGERSWAAAVVNDFRENLLKFLRSSSDQPFFQTAEFLTTGSYFEKVKIHSPDEFDMMLKLQAPSRLIMTEEVTTHYNTLAWFVREPRLHFRNHEMKLLMSPVCVLFSVFPVPDSRYRWEVNRKRPHSPAVTLSLCRTEDNSEEIISVDVVPALEVNGWPLAVRNGPDVDDWLGKKVRQEIKSLPCYFVPKRLKGRNQGNKEEFHLLSHSKQCLMLLKSLIEGLKQRFPKELDDLCSYHGKTVFLHTFNDSMWTPQQLPVCFLHLLGCLEDHARRGSLPHFFVSKCNLFSTKVFPRRALAFLVNALEEQRRQNLPLLNFRR